MKTRKPNVILILADDLGYADLSCYGSEVQYTPELDRLAAEGMRFTDFHANGPVCSPTRAALMTGCYQQRVGIEDALTIDGSLGLGPQVTLASYLKEQGYATGMSGKWHLGSKPEFSPNARGFDEFWGLLTGDGDYHSQIDRSGKKDWWHNGQRVEEAGYTTELITRHGLDFIEKHREEPFFLYIAHLAPHFPWQGPTDSADRVEGVDYRPGTVKFGSRPDKKTAFTEMVTALDQGVGQIREKLKACGLEEDTILIFMSDNGGYTQDKNGYVAVSHNGPFRGQKRDVYEGGHRVPAIFHWPEKIAPESECHYPAMGMDIFPTLLDLLSMPAPQDRRFDGVSLSPLLAGETELPPTPRFWRLGTGKAARLGDWKLVVNSDVVELFNLREDPGEQMDLSAEEPELVQSLLKHLQQWEQDVDAPQIQPEPVIACE